MTTIVAVARDGAVWMAADRRHGIGSLVWRGRVSKIQRWHGDPGPSDGDQSPDALLGLSGSSALGSLARHRVDLPAPPDRGDVDACDRWADQIVRRLSKAAARSEPKLVDDDDDVPFDGLLAYAGRLWNLGDQHAQELPDGVAVVGSGGKIALGSLAATLRRGVSPDDAVREAVETAAVWDPYTGDGVDVEHLPAV